MVVTSGSAVADPDGVRRQVRRTAYHEQLDKAVLLLVDCSLEQVWGAGVYRSGMMDVAIKATGG